MTTTSSSSKPKLDYAAVSEMLYNTRKGPILVVYQGEKTLEERKALDKLKGFWFLSDQIQFMHYLCGLEASGMIIEEGADVSYQNIRYVISRFRCKEEQLLLLMDEKHFERMNDAYEEIASSCSDPDAEAYVIKAQKRMTKSYEISTKLYELAEKLVDEGVTNEQTNR